MILIKDLCFGRNGVIASGAADDAIRLFVENDELVG